MKENVNYVERVMWVVNYIIFLMHILYKRNIHVYASFLYILEAIKTQKAYVVLELYKFYIRLVSFDTEDVGIKGCYSVPFQVRVPEHSSHVNFDA